MLRVTVLLISEVFPPQKGGSGRWFWELYRRLPLSVTVVAGAADGGEFFDQSHVLPTERLPLAFSSWGVLHSKSGTEYLRSLRAIRRMVRKVRPDVIHCGKTLPEGLLALAARRSARTPVWCYVHGEELRLARTSKELGFLTRIVLRGVTKCIANSAHTRLLLERDWGVPAGRVMVMNPGVDTTRFVPLPSDPLVRARFGWTDRLVVLTAGALQKRKGQDMLIRALPEIRRHCPRVLYSILGEGWERPYLERIVAECGVSDEVQFLGARSDDDLIQGYQQCDVFALPNRDVGWDVEGFGIVLLEAQACGKPVIAGNSGGTSDALYAGVTGELVNCEAVAPLAASVVRLLQRPDLANEMGRAGREWVVSHFDWAALASRATDIFSA